MSRQKRLLHLVETRVDDKTYEELKKLLSKSNCRYMSELVRDILCNRPVKVITYDKSKDKLLESLSAIRSELNAIGVNINQVTKYFNTEPKPSQRVYYSMQVAALYQSVGKKVDELLLLTSNLSDHRRKSNMSNALRQTILPHLLQQKPIIRLHIIQSGKGTDKTFNTARKLALAVGFEQLQGAGSGCRMTMDASRLKERVFIKGIIQA